MRAPVPALALAASLVACRTAAPPPPDIDPGAGTVWEFLHAKYDANGDGAIQASEYDRAPETFAQLDRDGDGILRRTDIESPEGDAMEKRMDAFRGQRAVVRFFQADDDTATLERAELEFAAGRYDDDGDGVLTRGELERGIAALGELAPDPMWEMMQRMGPGEPFDVLCASVDGDGDGALTTGELLAFFDARDDGDGVWVAEPVGPAPDEARPVSGVAEGSWAPDFTLSPPDDGAPVTLSSFRGDRPVALVFGSYT